MSYFFSWESGHIGEPFDGPGQKGLGAGGRWNERFVFCGWEEL